MHRANSYKIIHFTVGAFLLGVNNCLPNNVLSVDSFQQCMREWFIPDSGQLCISTF